MGRMGGRRGVKGKEVFFSLIKEGELFILIYSSF